MVETHSSLARLNVVLGKYEPIILFICNITLRPNQMTLDTFLYSSLPQPSTFLNQCKIFYSVPFYSIHKPADFSRRRCADTEWFIHFQRSFEVHVHVLFAHLLSCQRMTPGLYFLHTGKHWNLHTIAHIITSCTSALWSCPRQAAVQSKFNKTDPSHSHWCAHTHIAHR